MDVSFDEETTRYYGQKRKCAVVVIDSARFDLKLGDTARCAQYHASAVETLRNLARLAQIDPNRIEAFAPGLMHHCRALTGFKEHPKRDVRRGTDYPNGRVGRR